MIQCPKCEQAKPREEFYGLRKRSGWCKPCTRERSAAYYAANKEKQRNAHRQWVLANKNRVAEHKARANYGLSREQYAALMQSGKCAICGHTENLCIDHDHDTGQVRGVLCGPCNKGLGFLRDDPIRLQAGIDYLMKKPDIFAATYDEVS